MCCTGVAMPRRAYASSSACAPGTFPAARPASGPGVPWRQSGSSTTHLRRGRGSVAIASPRQDRATRRHRQMAAGTRRRPRLGSSNLICGPAAHCRIGCCRTAMARGRRLAGDSAVARRAARRGCPARTGSNAPDTAYPLPRPERPISNPPPQRVTVTPRPFAAVAAGRLAPLAAAQQFFRVTVAPAVLPVPPGHGMVANAVRPAGQDRPPRPGQQRRWRNVMANASGSIGQASAGGRGPPTWAQKAPASSRQTVRPRAARSPTCTPRVLHVVVKGRPGVSPSPSSRAKRGAGRAGSGTLVNAPRCWPRTA